MVRKGDKFSLAIIVAKAQFPGGVLYDALNQEALTA
jgi:hypothetical protein